MRACEILPRILIDNLHCFKHTWNSNVDAYHGKWAFMPSSVLELLPNFKSTYFASMNPPIVSRDAKRRAMRTISFFVAGPPRRCTKTKNFCYNIWC